MGGKCTGMRGETVQTPSHRGPPWERLRGTGREPGLSCAVPGLGSAAGAPERGRAAGGRRAGSGPGSSPGSAGPAARPAPTLAAGTRCQFRPALPPPPPPARCRQGRGRCATCGHRSRRRQIPARPGATAPGAAPGSGPPGRVAATHRGARTSPVPRPGPGGCPRAPRPPPARTDRSRRPPPPPSRRRRRSGPARVTNAPQPPRPAPRDRGGDAQAPPPRAGAPSPVPVPPPPPGPGDRSPSRPGDTDRDLFHSILQCPQPRSGPARSPRCPPRQRGARPAAGGKGGFQCSSCRGWGVTEEGRVRVGNTGNGRHSSTERQGWA